MPTRPAFAEASAREPAALPGGELRRIPAVQAALPALQRELLALQRELPAG